ncbi:alpha/beta fold hydrolase [Cryobacterium sp. CG_9.6]|uniref:alpha/beta fold hydrolase n=1 Tax=Cryobacterium sp. CG_9.6 TaxID=2760710 RepID=UPI002473210E|nr:alpha/beta fold hydrolase [Cryobacterium sp. CG_9.6]MDH6237142.1 pimeloyl-ACP methyl ester carboxylesterase [Cryobacterium sp. CG_9.6]
MDCVRKTLATADGVLISYMVLDGREPAVVIVHGLAGSGREFLPTARALSGRKVLLIDQRGHGFSTQLPEDTSRAAFVDDIVRILAVEALGAVDLVGHSMGAHTVMLVAAEHPDLVRRLVLLEANEGSGSKEDHAALGDYFRSWEIPFPSRKMASDTLGDGPLAHAWAADLDERTDGFYPKFDPDVMVATIDAVSVPRWKEWGLVTAPTLVVYADHGMFTEEQKATFIHHGANVWRVDLTSASHDAHLDAFDQWIASLNRFISVD